MEKAKKIISKVIAWGVKYPMLVIMWILVPCTLFYILPGAIATTRKHPNSMAIWLVNIFLGWSIIGWVVALVWSVLKSQAPVVHIHKDSSK